VHPHAGSAIIRASKSRSAAGVPAASLAHPADEGVGNGEAVDVGVDAS
jgi:hypothetical protein